MKIGIIGAGSIGSRHARNLIELGHDVLVYDPESGRHSGFYYRELVDNLIEDSEAIIISSPIPTHIEYAQKVIKAKKPVFIEKPIADHPFDGANLVAMVGTNLRFRSCVKATKLWMKEIGDPICANFWVGQYNDRYTDSAILNWGAHEIDLALYLLGSGRITGCCARSSNGRDDLADIIFVHNNGCHTVIHLDYLTKPEIRQFIIVGSQATIIVDVVHNQAWLRGADETVWDHSEEFDSFDSNYKDEMQAFIDRINGKKTIGATGEEGLEVLKVCLEARKQAGL